MKTEGANWDGLSETKGKDGSQQEVLEGADRRVVLKFGVSDTLANDGALKVFSCICICKVLRSNVI